MSHTDGKHEEGAVCWFDRLRGKTATEANAADIAFADVGVPDLAEPLYARALVLEQHHGSATVEIQPPGRESFRTELRSGTDPHGFSGLVWHWHAPVIIDEADPNTVILLEPPCGPDLPLVADDLQAIRDARDLRTSALTRRYPPPSADQLVDILKPTASAAHPDWDAVCYRLALLTTIEAQSILDGIRSDGNTWNRAEAHLYSWGPPLPDDLRERGGRHLAHLKNVAPQGSRLDVQPLWTFHVAALMRDLVSAEVDPGVFERVMRPFVDVCGPLPKQLL